MSSIITELNLYDSWYTAMRVISQTLTGHVAPLLFGPIGNTPEILEPVFYKKIKEEVELRKKNHIPYGKQEHHLKLTKETWPSIFTMKLLEYYQARLLGSFNNKDVYCYRSRKYCNILLDVVGEAQRNNDFRVITGQFFLMMKEYICNHLPGKEINITNTDFVIVLQECRARYILTNQNHKYYVDFEKNKYASGILELIDNLATKNTWAISPHCHYFILASEYLNAFAIYLYMIEYCIYNENQRKIIKNKKKVKNVQFEDHKKPPYYAPCVFDALEKYHFDSNNENQYSKRPQSLVVDNDVALPSNARVYLKDETTGKCYTIPIPGDWTIGRKDTDNPDIDIRIETEDLCISRYHARLTLKKNPLREFVLTICDDLNRQNATYVWRTPLSNKFQMQLFDGDKMLLGKTTFSVHIKY